MTEKKFFKLHGHCKFVEGSNGACIYNLMSGDIIELNDKFQNAFEQYSEKQGLSMTDNFEVVNELVEANLGFLTTQNNIYVDEVNFSISPMFEPVLAPNYTISNIFLEVTNECNLNCLFCSGDNMIIRSTGCKKYGSNTTGINEIDYESIIEQAKMLNVERVIILGGEPLLEMKKLENILKLCLKFELTPVIYSNGTILFTDVLKELLTKSNGEVIIQSLFNNDKDYVRYTGENRVWQKQKETIDDLLNKGIKVTAMILIGRFNDTMENTAIHYFADKKIPVTTQYIMPYPENDFYSIRLKEDLLDRRNFLSRVNSLTFYKNKKQQFCFSNMLAIDHNGDIFACPLLRDFSLGNVNTHKLREIFDNDIYLNLISLSK